jgi:hypothetical protein
MTVWKRVFDSIFKGDRLIHASDEHARTAGVLKESLQALDSTLHEVADNIDEATVNGRDVVNDQRIGERRIEIRRSLSTIDRRSGEDRRVSNG